MMLAPTVDALRHARVPPYGVLVAGLAILVVILMGASLAIGYARVMMVAIETEAEGQKKVAELIAENKVTFPVAKDRFNIVARRWLGTKSPLPSLFMVRPDGTISAVHRGYSQDGAELLGKEVELALGLKK